MSVEFNQQIIEEFRANRGRVGGMFAGARLLLLTTTGARTGAPHTLRLEPPGLVPQPRRQPEGDGRGRVFTYEANAVVLDRGERDRVFARAVEGDPGWADYQASTTRVIPVVALEEIPGPPNVNASRQARPSGRSMVRSAGNSP